MDPHSGSLLRLKQVRVKGILDMDVRSNKGRCDEENA